MGSVSLQFDGSRGWIGPAGVSFPTAPVILFNGNTSEASGLVTLGDPTDTTGALVWNHFTWLPPCCRRACCQCSCKQRGS
jgi:hypothetical protein